MIQAFILEIDETTGKGRVTSTEKGPGALPHMVNLSDLAVQALLRCVSAGLQVCEVVEYAEQEAAKV